VIYLGTGDGITYQDLARDPSVVTHESIHAMIDSYAGLGTEGESGAFNEGFADFFSALVLKNPRLGDSSYLKGPYRRTVENDWQAYRDFDEGVYRNGSIIAASLWDLRPALGDEKLARLAFRTLVRLGKGARFDDFAPAVMLASADLLTGEEQGLVAEKLRARGWRP
jgi:Zn-dependent metalloprotease